MRVQAPYPKDVFHKQRFPGFGHIGRDGGALGDGSGRDKPGLTFLHSGWCEHTKTLGRRKDDGLGDDPRLCPTNIYKTPEQWQSVYLIRPHKVWE